MEPLEGLTPAVCQAARETLADLFQNGEHYYMEIMSPDCTNTQRARRLNDPGCAMLQAWLEEAAEEEEP